MASPWEVHVAGASARETHRITVQVAAEVHRIEHKYSRYRDDGLVHAINHAAGKAIAIDDETARLLDYAQALWDASDGMFDITTGALRRAWVFDGSDRVPSDATIAALLPLVGWDKIDWNGETLRLPAGMEIDFGGIGKEYAVDRALALAAADSACPVLVNGGGDLAASAPPANGQPWRVGVTTGFDGIATPSLQLFRGAVATSGDAHRYVLRDGRRYGHVLDPRSGRPVDGAARSVTVVAASCSEAGGHSTIALLKGAGAEAYLQELGVEHWIYRDAH
ncbi:FAD:protein FMN transferase [Solimonas terrae]|uniref:FAD:protein FMN transferase n=1 Tax=Solimonas terrae TaxID=1396819 RepID=A0A6M2BNT0_9GAMM|nr:FAD:protein FMN transferase [Solimonas terrae]NGY03875.1 FAD:protein FMN transferase [Solimonas terrae]